MEFLTNLLDNSSMPWITALLLGLMTAISPCPLATNITAVGFISKDLENRNRVFFNGLFYTLGRVITYTLIPLIIYIGADQFKFSGFFQRYGEKIIFNKFCIDNPGWYFMQCPDKPENVSGSSKEWRC